MKIVNLYFLTLAIAVLTSCSLREPASISGVVRDEQGPVAGATVRLKATGHSALTDETGHYIIDGLTPGQPAVITAWAPGYYIVGGEEVMPGEENWDLTLKPIALEDNASYTWLSAFASAGDESNCQNCHSDEAGSLPFDQWHLDAHSQTASNLRFLTMYAGTDMNGNQSPATRKGFSRDYGSFPMRPDLDQPYYGPGYKLDFPNTAGNCAACHLPVAAINDPYQIDPRSAEGVASEGVACDFCHKVWDVNLDVATGLPYLNMPGVLSFEFRRPPEGHQFFAGPFDDVAPGEDTYTPIQAQSQYCAPCHFGVFWDTTIYNSFGEWLESPYSDPETGQTCQDCHMPPIGEDHFARIEVGASTRNPQTIFSHQMPGASDVELLQNAVTMTVEVARRADQLVVDVLILNDKTGHHVPTDSPLRHLILLVQAYDKDGSRLPLAQGPALPDWVGVGDPGEGYYAGLPGQAYAKVLQELWTEVFPTGAYWIQTRVLSDNRIPALGQDTTSYIFEVNSNGEISIDVQLIFRRAFIQLMEWKGWEVPDILMEQEQMTIK